MFFGTHLYGFVFLFQVDSNIYVVQSGLLVVSIVEKVLYIIQLWFFPDSYIQGDRLSGLLFSYL
jgi:hypothetical protein